MKTHEQEFITPQELINRYRGAISIRTLANWRSSGEGPRYAKIGGRVLYPVESVLKWEAKRSIGK